MANLLDYVDWRGDIPFAMSPFNEVDNMLFAELSYINFTDIIPEMPKYGSITLYETMRTYAAVHRREDEKLGLLMPDLYLEMARRMAKSRRFRDVKLTGYVHHIDNVKQEQFSALSAEIGDGTWYIAYTGTDDTIAGWKEDLNLAFLASIPAQEDAKDYAALMAASVDGDLRIGGHSKGGNLAMYAAATNVAKLGERIIRVYNNDGPGFLRPMVESDGFRAVKDRILTITPFNSFVGSLLDNDSRRVVIESNSKTTLMEHDGYTWQVLGTRFVERPEGISPESRRIKATMTKWLDGISSDDRCELVDILYKLMCANGATTLTELYEDKTALMKGYKKLSAADKDIAKLHLKRLAAAGGESMGLRLKTSDKLIRS